MAGSWEIKQSKTILLGILHTEITTIAWAIGLRNLILPDGMVFPAGMPFCHARNHVAQMCLSNGFEYLAYLDSDVIPPRDAFLRLMAHRKPVISDLYCRRSPPAGVPVMMKPVGRWITQFTPGSLIEVDVIGAGCLLIHRSVLEKLPPHRPGKPRFDWRVDMQGFMPKEECLSEDFTFCMAVKQKLGIPVYVDTSVVCRHVGNAQAVYDGLEPLDAVALT